MSYDVTECHRWWCHIFKKILKFAENKIIFIKLWIELKFWWYTVRELFFWASFLPPRKSVYGETCRHCWIPELLKIISQTNLQSVTHGSILSMSKGKLHYFMKIKYFFTILWTTLCEPIFTQLQRKWTDLWPIEIKLTVSDSIDKMNTF